MRLDDLAGRRVVLLGLGADVSAAVPAVLAAHPAEVRAVEEGDVAGARLFADRWGVVCSSLADAAAWGEVFLRSPGFPRYQPVLVEALARGARMTTPLDLWLGTFGRDRVVVAITGTKGKSTVTALVGSLADRAGLRVGLAGNLGVPVFDDGWDHDAPIIVLEVSSYQAADLHHAPDVAVVTFLSEDHLSWHGGLEPYVADKLRVVANDGGIAGRVLLPVDGGRAAEAVAALGSAVGAVLPVEVVAPPVARPAAMGAGPGAGDGAAGGAGEADRTRADGDVSVPRHRLQNAALAARVVAILGGPELRDEEVVEAARSSLPGRLDVCPAPAGRPGVLGVDDALASNPSATAAGLAWLRDQGRATVVLLGGADRGVDPSPLVDEAARWPAGLLRAVALAENGAALAAAAGIGLVPQEGARRTAGGAGPSEERDRSAAGLRADGELRDAVERALAWLPADGVVVFSPAAPTPAGSGNWATRSAAFRRALAEPRS